MTIHFHVALPWFFLAIFIIGFYLGVVAHRYKLELDKAGEDYDKNFNCMGIRKPPPHRLPLPLPKKPKR